MEQDTLTHTAGVSKSFLLAGTRKGADTGKHSPGSDWEIFAANRGKQWVKPKNVLNPNGEAKVR